MKGINYMSQSQVDQNREAVLAGKYSNKTITAAERAEFGELVEQAV